MENGVGYDRWMIKGKMDKELCSSDKFDLYYTIDDGFSDDINKMMEFSDSEKCSRKAKEIRENREKYMIEEIIIVQIKYIPEEMFSSDK